MGEADDEDIDRFLYGEEGADAIKQIPMTKVLSNEKLPPPPPPPFPTQGDDNSMVGMTGEDGEYEGAGGGRGRERKAGKGEEAVRVDEEGSFEEDEEGENEINLEDEDDEIEIVLEGDSKSQKLASNTTKSTIDLNTIGQLNGTSIMETDLESFEDRPWRKPGADLTDYFNYGFTEQTWRLYCAKQRSLRDDPNFRETVQLPFIPPPPPPPPNVISGRPSHHPHPPPPPMMPFMPPPFMFRPPPPPPHLHPPPHPHPHLSQQQASSNETPIDDRKRDRRRSKSRSKSRSRDRRESRRSGRTRARSRTPPSPATIERDSKRRRD